MVGLFGAPLVEVQIRPSDRDPIPLPASGSKLRLPEGDAALRSDRLQRATPHCTRSGGDWSTRKGRRGPPPHERARAPAAGSPRDCPRRNAKRARTDARSRAPTTPSRADSRIWPQPTERASRPASNRRTKTSRCLWSNGCTRTLTGRPGCGATNRKRWLPWKAGDVWSIWRENSPRALAGIPSPTPRATLGLGPNGPALRRWVGPEPSTRPSIRCEGPVYPTQSAFALLPKVDFARLPA